MATGSSKSSYLEAALLNWLKGTAFPASPATIYIALYTALATDASASGTEVSGGSYARAALTTSTAWSAITDGGKGVGSSMDNAGTITFPTPTAAWGTVVGMAIYDALTGGNEIYEEALAASKAINSGDTVTFAAGVLTVTED